MNQPIPSKHTESASRDKPPSLPPLFFQATDTDHASFSTNKAHSGEEHHLGGVYPHAEFGPLNENHPLPSVLPISTNPSIHSKQEREPKTPLSPPPKIKVPRWKSFNTQMKEAAQALFHRKTIQEAHRNMDVLEQALAGDASDFDTYIHTLSQKPSTANTGINAEQKTEKNSKPGIKRLKEKLLLFVSPKKRAEKTSAPITPTISADPSPPTRSASSDSATTLVSSEDQDSALSDEKALCQPAALSLVRTTMQVCDGDIALSTAVLEKLTEPLYSPTVIKDAEGVSTPQLAPEIPLATPSFSLATPTMPVNIPTATPSETVSDIDSASFFESGFWDKETLSAAEGLADDIQQELANRSALQQERVDYAAFECAKTIAKTRSLALAPLLAQQCNKPEEELHLTGLTKESALLVYLQTSEALGLQPGHTPLQFDDSDAATPKQKHAQLANLSAQKILTALSDGKSIRLEDPKTPAHAHPMTQSMQTPEEQIEDGLVKSERLATLSDTSITLTEEEWHAYICFLWGYHDPSPKASLDVAIGRILKRETHLDRAQTYQEAHTRRKKAKYRLKQEGLSLSGLSERLQAQVGILGAYLWQVIGKHKTPNWLPRGIFFSADDAINEKEYRDAVNIAIEYLKARYISQLGSASDDKTLADAAFNWARLEAWRQNKGKTYNFFSRFSAVTHILKITQELLNANAETSNASEYFLKNRDAYKKELSHSSITFLSKPAIFSIQKLEEIADSAFSPPSSTVMSDETKKLKEGFDEALKKALRYSRAAPIQEVREHIKNSKDLSENTMDTIVKMQEALIVNMPPGSSYIAANENPRGVNTGPLYTISELMLMPSAELGREYNRSTISQINTHEDGFSMAWGTKQEKQFLIGAGLYKGLHKAIENLFKTTFGVSANTNRKYTDRTIRQTVLRVEYSPDHLSGTEEEQRANREQKAHETLQLLQNLVPNIDNTSLKGRQNRPTRTEKKQAEYQRRQQYLRNITRACFYRPDISISEQVIYSKDITNTYSAQGSVYGGSVNNSNVPTIGPMLGVHVEHTPYAVSHTFKNQNGQHKQQSTSRGKSIQAKKSISLGMFASVIPIRMPARIEITRLRRLRQISMVTEFEQPFISDATTIHLESSTSNARLQPASRSLLVEIKRPKFTNFGKESDPLHLKDPLNKQDKALRNQWEEKYGREVISNLVENCTEERHSKWALRERYVLAPEYQNAISIHTDNLEVLEAKLASLKAARSKYLMSTSKMRALEAEILTSAERIELIHAGKLGLLQHDPTKSPIILKKFDVDNITTKSRSRGFDLVLKLQRQQDESVILRTASLTPLTPAEQLASP